MPCILRLSNRAKQRIFSYSKQKLFIYQQLTSKLHRLSKMPTVSEYSVLGEILPMIFSTSDRRAIASGLEASGTINPAIPELITDTKRDKKSQTAIDAKAAVTVF